MTEKTLSIDDVFEAIRQERVYQDSKWGKYRYHTIMEYVAIAEDEFEEAKKGWRKNDQNPRSTALEELVQVAAVIVACLEQHGIKGNKNADK